MWQNSTGDCGRWLVEKIVRMIDEFLRKPQIMAIVNVTDDSFFAGSRTPERSAVVLRVERAVADGATVIDVGGYSSRASAADIPTEEEWRRVDSGLSAVREADSHIAVSVDTFRAEIVRRAADKYGELIVNDISAGEADAEMIPTVASLGLPYIAMHMRGTPQTMQSLTDYEDVVAEVRDYLAARACYMISQGMRRENIILDPGFGFAKTAEQNYRLLGGLHEICALGYPVLAGMSRKSMIYRLLGITPEESLCGTQVLNWEALRQGASILRVHDVREAAQTLKMYETFKR